MPDSKATGGAEADVGEQMHALCRELFPICRSITGDGFRRSLAIIQRLLPALTIHEVPSGATCFDWEIPPEWNIRDAYIIAPDGTKICDFQRSNLHVVGYSVPVNRTMALAELQQHLHSLPEQPTAIPYVTSYYERRWGFCISQDERSRLRDGQYRVVIDSELRHGSLTYGELILPGTRPEEVFLSTYLCHPSMANNELSGPTVATFLARWLDSMPSRKYTYRLVFVPETIGAIAYLSRNLEVMQTRVLAGFNLTCVGDDRTYSYLPSRRGDTLADKAARHVLAHLHPDFVTYSFLDRGSDERQYCSPGVDLPVCSIMRSKYHTYPEYHTSLDDLTFVTPTGLAGSLEVMQRTIECVERTEYLKATTLGEPQLGKRGLYPTLSIKGGNEGIRATKNLLAYADGRLSTLEMADVIKVPLWELADIIDRLKHERLLVPIQEVCNKESTCQRINSAS